MAEKKKSPVLLITAFEPFDGASTNSSLIMLEELAKQDWDGKVVFFGPIPVSFADAWPIIEHALNRYPDIQGVICMGQAEGATRISLERMAVNRIHAGIPDNDGAKPRGPVIDGAPQVLKALFPWHELEESPHWECTYNAGAYVCNAVMFSAIHWAREEEKFAGFIHLPLMESQKGDKGLGEKSFHMKDDVALKSLTRIIDFALESLEPDYGLKPKPAPQQKFNPGPPIP